MKSHITLVGGYRYIIPFVVYMFIANFIEIKEGGFYGNDFLKIKFLTRVL